ncbi:hypothetical protein QC281_00335 [Streptomyces sp. DH17]|nr:hypothetical protein [Streptomyces sp. DH17]
MTTADQRPGHGVAQGTDGDGRPYGHKGGAPMPGTATCERA